MIKKQKIVHTRRSVTVNPRIFETLFQARIIFVGWFITSLLLTTSFLYADEDDRLPGLGEKPLPGASPKPALPGKKVGSSRKPYSNYVIYYTKKDGKEKKHKKKKKRLTFQEMAKKLHKKEVKRKTFKDMAGKLRKPNTKDKNR